MAAKNSTISIKYDRNQLPIYSSSPGEGKKSVKKFLNCISLWYIHIHPISKCLIVKYLEYSIYAKLHSIDV